MTEPRTPEPPDSTTPASPASRHLVTAALLAVGVIHVLPLPGVLGSARLAALYGLSVQDPDLLLLLRHRAVLFGLLGAFILVAAFRPALQATALAAGWVSVVSFLALAAPESARPEIARVVRVDRIALACLAVGTLARASRRRKA